jgi:uncharacterized membrane protein
MSVLLTGALLALFGQTYQTGADIFELFFVWAALAFPFALASASAATWMAWWVVLNVAMGLYCGLENTSVLRLVFASRLGIERPLLILFAGLVNLGGAVLFDHLGRARWLARVLATFGFAFCTVASLMALFGTGFEIDRKPAQDALVILAFAAACGGIAWATLRRRTDVYPMALIFGAWIVISTAFIVRNSVFRDLGMVLVVAVWLVGTSGAAGFVLMRWVREWRAT